MQFLCSLEDKLKYDTAQAIEAAANAGFAHIRQSGSLRVRTPLPLGLACVAAATAKAGFEVRLLDLLSTPDWKSAAHDAIATLHPDVIGLSVRNIDDQTMLNPRFLLPPMKEVIALCRSVCGAPIVLGGAGFSILPEPTLSYLGADMGIAGEGETTLPVCCPGSKKARKAPRLQGCI